MAKVQSFQDRMLMMDEDSIWDRAVTGIRTHPLLMSGILALLFLLGAGSVYWQYQRAVEALHQGIAHLQKGEAAKATQELVRVQNSSVGKAERGLGFFYLAEAYMKLDKKADAVRTYDQALAVMDVSQGSYLVQLILVRSAQAMESIGTEDMAVQARRTYERATEIEGPLRADALLAAGRPAEKFKDSAGAQVYYSKLSAINPTHPLASVFQERLKK